MNEILRDVIHIVCAVFAVVAGIAAAYFYHGAIDHRIWVFSGVTVVTFLLAYLCCLLILPKKKERTGDYGSAHWATQKEIEQSGLISSDGIVVGALKNRKKVRLLRYSGEGHVFVVSPTRSGKGVSVVVPTVLTWKHSILVNDIKGELWTLTSGFRKTQYDSVCLRFDATCEDGTAARWNPLYEIRPFPHDVRDAQNIALTLTTGEMSSRSENERHWRVMGTRLLKAAILHQLYVGRDKSLAGCYKLLTSLGRDLEDTLLMMLRTEHDPSLSCKWTDEMTGKATATHPAVAHIARDMLSKSDRERNSIVSSTISYVEPFDDPILAGNVSESDFGLLDLMNHDKPVSLYLTTPVADLERVQAIHRLLFTLAGVRNTEHLDFENGLPKAKYKHRLLEVFDECAHLGYSPVIQKQFSLASGFGIQGMFVFQDFSQLFDLYGQNESITSNCDIKITFAPNNLQTADYISRLLGNETRVREESKKGLFGQKQGNKHLFARALLTPDECSRLPKDKSIVIRNGFPPIMGDKVPYYLIKELVAQTRIAPAVSEKIPHREARWFETIGRQEKAAVQVKKNRKSRKDPQDLKGQGELFSSILIPNERGDV